MSQVLISVIVPVFNVERYLAACLDSILSQNYLNLEVIVINDGSTDFSLKIAETYAEKDNRVKIYSHENEGLSQARNRGLEVATGELVTFVDSDDMLLPGALEVMRNAMADNDADLAEGVTVRKNIAGDIQAHTSNKIITFTPKEAIADVLYQKRLLPSACGKLFKRSLFENLKFEPGILYEDLNIFYRVLEKCRKIIWIEYPVYFYRITEGSIVNSWKPQRLDVLKVTENLETYIEEKYPDLLPSAHDRRLSANFNMFALCSLNGDKDNATKCWENIKRYRRQSFLNPNVRAKNKAGILLSYLGKHTFRLFSRMVYKQN